MFVCVCVCTSDKHLKYSRGANDIDDEGLLDLIGSKVKINLTPTFASGNHLEYVRLWGEEGVSCVYQSNDFLKRTSSQVRHNVIFFQSNTYTVQILV